MKKIGLYSIIFALTFCCCNQNNQRAISSESIIENSDFSENPESLKKPELNEDEPEIQNLIRQVLKWAESKNSIDVLPLIGDSNNICIGFNLDKHQQNIEKLKATNFFAIECIDNYNQIILKLDKEIKNEAEKWDYREIPPFSFTSDHDPWCNCQDVPYDNPCPWDYIKIEVVSLTEQKGELYWEWGYPEKYPYPKWTDSRYYFRVIKENNMWKIAYLQEFDLQ